VNCPVPDTHMMAGQAVAAKLIFKVFLVTVLSVVVSSTVCLLWQSEQTRQQFTHDCMMSDERHDRRPFLVKTLHQHNTETCTAFLGHTLRLCFTGHYYVAVRKSHTIALASLSVHPSICPYGLLLKLKRRRKTKIGANIPQDRSKRVFQFTP